jgi:RimJ/RimL family protein N-acetyltransferase
MKQEEFLALFHQSAAAAQAAAVTKPFPAGDRLVLRPLTLDDAAFIVELVNEPGWLQYIGDRDIHSEEEARRYLRSGPMAMVERLGFGLLAVERTGEGIPIGICGLLRRETLADVDIGFAFLARYGGQGYAAEAAAAVLRWGQQTLGLRRIVAIVAPGNERSLRLLAKIGMQDEGTIELEGETLRLFGVG